ETLQDLVRPSGTIGIMSSGQGSIASNENGNYEVYRGSKEALNMFMRSFAARHADDPRTLLLMAPGWVRTDMGGPQARLCVEQSIPNLANTMDAQAGKNGSSVSGLPRPEGSVVSANMRIVAVRGPLKKYNAPQCCFGL